MFEKYSGSQHTTVRWKSGGTVTQQSNQNPENMDMVDLRTILAQTIKISPIAAKFPANKNSLEHCSHCFPKDQ